MRDTSAQSILTVVESLGLALGCSMAGSIGFLGMLDGESRPTSPPTAVPVVEGIFAGPVFGAVGIAGGTALQTIAQLLVPQLTIAWPFSVASHAIAFAIGARVGAR